MDSSAFELSSVRQTLKHMLNAGLIRLENLDEPSPGFKETMHVDLKTFPKGYRGVRHRNLLRDDSTNSDTF